MQGKKGLGTVDCKGKDPPDFVLQSGGPQVSMGRGLDDKDLGRT